MFKHKQKTDEQEDDECVLIIDAVETIRKSGLDDEEIVYKCE